MWDRSKSRQGGSSRYGASPVFSCNARGSMSHGSIEHVGIVHGCLIVQGVALTPQSLDDPHVVRVEPAGPPQPADVVEPDDVDDQRIAFPTAHRVAVERLVLRIHGVMRAPIGRDHAPHVSVLVEQDDVLRGLDDPHRRTEAWDAGRETGEGRVFLVPVFIEILDAFPELRLVQWRVPERPLREPGIALGVQVVAVPVIRLASDDLRLGAHFAGRERRRVLRIVLELVHLPVRLDRLDAAGAGTAAAPTAPPATQIRFAIRRARSGDRGGTLRSPSRLSPDVGGDQCDR